MKSKYIFFIVFAFVIITSIARAQDLPLGIYYQGNLTDADGKPVDGTCNIIFNIWGSKTSTSPNYKIWEEVHNNVSVNNGLFNVILGSKDSLSVDLFTSQERYLQIEINKEVLIPRQKIVSVPYSFIASSISGESNIFPYRGKVGIGTLSPTEELEVEGTIHSTSGGFKFPDNTVQVTAAGGGSGTGGNTLDQAYDQGGPGAGRAITADAGAVHIGGTGGLTVNGKVGIGTSSPGNHQLMVTSSGIGTAGSTVRVENDHVDGLSMIVSNTNTESSDYALIASQHGSGGIFRCDSWTDGWHPVFKVKNEGEVECNSLLAQSDSTGHTGFFENTKSDNDYSTVYAKTNGPGYALHAENNNPSDPNAAYFKGQIEAVSSGSGTGGVTARFTNEHSNGIGVIVSTTSEDVTMLASQHGEGDILRCDSWTGGWHPVFKVGNNGKTTCSVLEITGGSDITEPFDILEKHTIKPGMVVVIDSENPEKLKISDKEYDRCVAGIVSGAGGINPGISMAQKTDLKGEHQVALTGRVYGLCDASYGSIKPGDLLTTSPKSGHAMKVKDYKRAQGAILGKAMTNLEQGQGLVLILVTLQ